MCLPCADVDGFGERSVGGAWALLVVGQPLTVKPVYVLQCIYYCCTCEQSFLLLEQFCNAHMFFFVYVRSISEMSSFWLWMNVHSNCLYYADLFLCHVFLSSLLYVFFLFQEWGIFKWDVNVM